MIYNRSRHVAPGRIHLEPEPDEAFVRACLLESAELKRRLADEQDTAIVRAAQTMIAALSRGRKVLAFGNGGSAADAQHFAGELMGRLGGRSRPAFPVIALSADTSVLTGIGNDFGFEDVFCRQVQALAQEGDVVLGISTSGRSPNVLGAIAAARAARAITIGLCGGSESPLAVAVDFAVAVPSGDTQRIQEAHIAVLHILAELVERALIGANP